MVQLSFHECIGGVCDGCVAGSSLSESISILSLCYNSLFILTDFLCLYHSLFVILYISVFATKLIIMAYFEKKEYYL